MCWMFAYGSLMWDFAFTTTDQQRGTLAGYHRDFNKKSIRAWGTPETPGPVLGLEPGGECDGLAFRVPDAEQDTVIDTLNEREGPSYDRHEQSIELADGRTVTANVWINSPDKDTYIGRQSVEKRARLAARASGPKGSAEEYVLRTCQKLDDLGIEDQHISEFVRAVREVSDTNRNDLH